VSIVINEPVKYKSLFIIRKSFMPLLLKAGTTGCQFAPSHFAILLTDIGPAN